MTEDERRRYEYERAHRAAQTAETWQVIDETGTAHEVAARPTADGAAWVARDRCGETVVHGDPRGAVVLLAQACGWGIAEVLAPGQVAQRARTLLDAPTHERCDEQRDEIMRLKASCAALLAAWERSEEAIALVLQAQGSAEPETIAREIGVRLGYPLLADVATLAATAPTARAEGAREMREAAAKACERVTRAMAAQANAAASCDCGCGGANEAAFTYAAGGARECADAVQSEPIAVQYARCSTGAVAGGAQ